MGSQKAKIAWAKIKNEYLSTDISYRELAKKYDVSLRMISYKAKEEDWQTAKQKHCNTVATQLQQKTIEKTSESLSDYAVRQTADIVKINELLISKVYETMSYGDAFSPRDLKSLSGLLSDLMMNRKSMMEEIAPGTSDADRITVEFVKGEWDA